MDFKCEGGGSQALMGSTTPHVCAPVPGDRSRLPTGLSCCRVTWSEGSRGKCPCTEGDNPPPAFVAHGLGVSKTCPSARLPVQTVPRGGLSCCRVRRVRGKPCPMVRGVWAKSPPPAIGGASSEHGLMECR